MCLYNTISKTFAQSVDLGSVAQSIFCPGNILVVHNWTCTASNHQNITTIEYHFFTQMPRGPPELVAPLTSDILEDRRGVNKEMT